MKYPCATNGRGAQFMHHPVDGGSDHPHYAWTAIGGDDWCCHSGKDCYELCSSCGGVAATAAPTTAAPTYAPLPALCQQLADSARHMATCHAFHDWDSHHGDPGVGGGLGGKGRHRGALGTLAPLEEKQWGGFLGVFLFLSEFYTVGFTITKQN